MIIRESDSTELGGCIMKKGFLIVSTSVVAASVLAGCGSSGGTSSKQVTITYWQYNYPSKVTAVDKLIKDFEQQNPSIKVQQETFPYDQYTQKVTAAMHASKGPDVMNLYYGWIPQYVQEGYLQPIPQDFMSTQQINDYYIPMVQDSQIDGKYYTLPTAVRSLALFWNKDMFQKAGLDPNSPPKTWDELIKDAQKMTVYKGGKLVQEGYAPDVAGQGYHVFEEVMLRQWGVTPFSDDHKTVQWNASPAGEQAFQYWMDMMTKDKIGQLNYETDYETAFKAGNCAMIIDGSFALAATKKAVSFQWGVAPMPVKDAGGVQSNFGSYWVNGIAKGVAGDKLAASEKFLKFLTSTDTQKYWLDAVGELPAAKSLSNDATIASNPLYGPFVKGLQDAHATYFVNEADERQAVIDETNKIVLKNAAADSTFTELVQKEQALRDKYYNK
jgi:multiple sugar transport system substrate-binding protein